MSQELFRRVPRGSWLLTLFMVPLTFMFPLTAVAADVRTYVVCKADYYDGVKFFTERFTLMENEDDSLFKGGFTPDGRVPRVMTREYAAQVPSNISHYDNYFPGVVASGYQGSHFKSSFIDSIFYQYVKYEYTRAHSLYQYGCYQFIGAENADNFIAKLKRNGYDRGPLKGWYPDAKYLGQFPDLKYLALPSGTQKQPTPVADKDTAGKPSNINKPTLTIKSTDTPLADWTPAQLARAREAAAEKARNLAKTVQNDAKAKVAWKKFHDDMKKRGSAQ